MKNNKTQQSQEKEKNFITIDITQEVINDVLTATAGKSPLYQSKALFMVYLINRGDRLLGQKEYSNNTYQLHVRAHRNIFNSKDFESIKKILLDSNIITPFGVASAEESRCHTYRVVKRWKFKGSNTTLIHLPNQYTFVQKFIDCNFWIMPKREDAIKNLLIENIKPQEVVIEDVVIEQVQEEEKVEVSIENTVIEQVQEEIKVELKKENMIDNKEEEFENYEGTGYDQEIKRYTDIGIRDNLHIEERIIKKYVYPSQPTALKEISIKNIKSRVKQKLELLK